MSGILETSGGVSWTSCGVGMSMPVPAVSDSICCCDESASTSAGESSGSSVPSVVLPSVSSVLHSLLLKKGMDRLLHVIACGLPCK